jgi:hypothetical protein
MVLAAASTIATAAIALSFVLGVWAPALLLLAAAGAILVVRLDVRIGNRRLPVEVEAGVVEGVLAPLLGMTLVASPPGTGLELLVVLVPLALASSASVYSHEGLRILSGLRSVLRWPAAAPVIPGVLSLVIAAVLVGIPFGFSDEQALLVVAPASLAVFVCWLVLADPRPEWRVRRVRMLSLASVVALQVSLILVLAFF